MRSGLRHFGQNSDLRKTRPDIVVQVGGDAGAHALEGEEMRDARAIDNDEQCQQAGEERQKEPRLPPERRCNAEGDAGDLGAQRRLVG